LSTEHAETVLPWINFVFDLCAGQIFGASIGNKVSGKLGKPFFPLGSLMEPFTEH
jgi:hypothetical protein